MSDPLFDSLMQQERRRAAGVPDRDPLFEQLMEAERAKARAIRGTLDTAVEVSPDTYAAQRDAAATIGLPPAAAGVDPYFETQAKIAKIQRATQGAPVLQRKYTEEDFAKLAHDDSGVLATIESVVKYLVSAPRTERTLMGDIGAGLARRGVGVSGYARAGLEAFAPIFDLPIFPENPLRRAAGSMAWVGRGGEARAKELSPPTDDIVAGGISSGVQSFVQSALGMPLLAVPGGQAAFLAEMSAVAGGEAYQKAREKGKTFGEALPFAASQAVIEYATEKIPVARLVGDLARNASLRQVLMRQIAAEVPGEQVATILQDMNEWAVLNPEKPFSSYLAERPSAAAQTLIATIVGVGGNVALSRTLEAVLVPAEERARRAEAAEQTAQMLEQLDALVRAAKLRDRDAPTFEQFIAQVAEDGPAETVYVPAQVLMQSGIGDALAQVSPSVAQQLPTAAASGGYVAIPVAEYATRIAGTEYSQELLDHLKVDPNGMSRAEATQYLSEYQDKLKEQVEAALGERAADASWRESAEKVRAEIRDSLNAAGAYRADVNDAGALLASSWFSTMAAKLGMTPEQMYKKRPLFVRSQWMPGEQVLDQGATLEQVSAQWQKAVRGFSPKDMNFAPAMPSPTVLREVGFKDPRISLPSRVLMQIGKDHPDVPADVVERLPALLSDPLYVFSHREGGWDVVIDARTAKGEPIIVGVRDGRVRTITPQHNVGEKSGWARLAEKLRTAMAESGKVYARNDEAPVRTGASTSAPDGDNSLEVLLRGKARLLTRATLVKRYGEEYYQAGWHGSPHRGIRQFSTDFVGAGEGNQAYGWGLYFASMRDVAEWYRRELSATYPPTVVKDGRELTPAEVAEAYYTPGRISEGDKVLQFRREGDSRWSVQVVRVDADGNVMRGEAPRWHSTMPAYETLERTLSDEGYSVRRGQLYAVEIPEDDEMLDWDKPLSEQPQIVREALEKAAKGDDVNAQVIAARLEDGSHGGDLYQSLGADIEDRDVSQFLASLGIKGIKYLDRGSRAAGEGSHNYVIFSGDDVAITNQFYQGEQDGPLGTFNPATNTITLRKRANLSTFPHELGHFFLEAQFAITAELKAKAEKDGIESLTEGEREILSDTDGLLKWLGEQDHVAAFNSLRQIADGLEREAKTNPQVAERARIAREAYEYADERGREGFMKEVAETWGRNVPAELRFYLLTPYHEYWARGFENYLYEGKAPSVELQSLFQKFRAFILSAYRRVLAAAKGGMPEVLNVRLTDNARRVMDRMLATTEQIKLAEQSRSMIPLWSTPEQAGMTPERFAAYQAQFLEGTQEAIQDLQARALRDLAWTRNARGREIRRLQRQERERRRELTIEVRREVMSDPVYRAWQFLTAKIDRDNMTPGQAAAEQYRKDAAAWRAQRRGVEETARHEVETQAWDASEEGQKKYRKLPKYEQAKRRFLKAKADEIDAAVAARMEAWVKANPAPEKPAGDGPPKSSPDRVDETIDSLFVAIAKLGGLNKEEVVGTWGTDPADKPASGVFGRPVWRVEGGLSIDAMAEALVQYGYLTPDENGKPDLRELEDKFRDELAGDAQYSFSHTPYVEMPAGSEIANPAGLTAGRLDVDSLRAMGIPREITDFIIGLKMTSKNGLHPDVAAEIIVMEDGSPAFSSGDELVRSLAAAQTPREEIESRVDQRMLEQYGELATPEAIERAADEAIHNEARARFIATEANALAEATGQPKVLAAAARAFAAQVIARLRIRDIRPAQYAAAEARAAGAAAAASRSGDLALAAAEKRNQVAQNYATREAYASLDEVERGVRYLRRFNREGARKGLDAEYVQQIDALLERFDLRPTSVSELKRRDALRSWVEKQRAQGIEPAIPEDILEEAFRTSYKNLTMEEFRGLVESVKQIEHLARLKKRLLASQDQREYEAIRDEIAASIVANAGDRKADTRTPTTMLGRRLQKIRQFGAEHIKAATWARVFDGGKDGGPVWEHIIRPANERADMETTMRAEATLRLSEILSPVFKLGKMGGKGTFFPTIARSLNRESRIAIALNVGNEGNLQRLLGGEGWTFAQLQPVLQSLTEAEWRAVQQVWDYMDSFRPMIAAKERRIYGVEPDWVVPTPFTMTTADGKQIQLQGGYYPIKYDPAASQRAEENADAEAAREMLQGAFTSATTRRSFTKARANEVVGRPLLYSLEGVYAGVNEVIHDLAWHEWLIDTNRLLRSDTIDRAIREHYGPEAKAQFKMWVKRIADGDKTVDQAGEAVIGRLRQGISAAGLGFNVMSAALQVLGFTQSIVRVGAPWVGRGIAQYIASPIASSREVVGKSAFMAARSRTRFRELSELRDRVQDESDTMRGIKAGTFFLMSRAQQMVDVPTWIGAYEKAIAEGNEEARAIALADQAVIDAQGGGQTKDLAAIEGGHAFKKLFSVFYSFMNTTLNLATGKTMTARTPAQRARLAVDYLMLFTVPAVLGAMLKDALTPGGGDDDWEQLARKLAAEQLSYLMGLMVFVREAQGLAKIVMGAEGVRGYEGPAGLRFFPDLYKLATQANQGEFDDAFRKAAINVVGDLTGLPSAQINRTWTGIEALAEGETDNPAAVVFGFQRQ